MNVLEIPFNKFFGLKMTDQGSEYIFIMEEKNEYLNHLGTFHAGCLYSFAEITSGQFLLDEFKEFASQVVPVVRKVEVKYNKPGNGKLFSKAELFDTKTEIVTQDLQCRKRAIVKIKVDVYNETKVKLMTSVFEWFIALVEN